MGLDVNRNFPADWAPYWEQAGAGEFPLSEPETRALAEFLVAHPNIHGSQHFHTQSGVILRPHTSKPDDDLPQFDVRTYKAIGAMGEEETGYPCISIFHDFAYDKKVPIKGGLTDWVYEQLGVFTFATELWSLPKKAGIEVTDYIEFFKTRSDDVDLAMLKLLDDELDGYGYKEWTHIRAPPARTGRDRWLGLPVRVAEPAGPMARGGDVHQRSIRDAGDENCAAPGDPVSDCRVAGKRLVQDFGDRPECWVPADVRVGTGQESWRQQTGEGFDRIGETAAS